MSFLMKKEISDLQKFTVEEFQEDFDNLMDRVEGGESFVITSEYGNAVMVPYDEETDTFGTTPFSVTIRSDNLTGDRVIRFPDADATLLSTENVTTEDVSFGAGIGGQTLTGRTRQQQFFYAGF